jgi:diguanylate cyclase (GGDEF)-like protein
VSESSSWHAGGQEEHEGDRLLLEALAAAGQTAYSWSLASDRLAWSANAAEVLGVADASLVMSGRGYASLLDPDNFTSRFEAVMHTAEIDEGEGVPFQIEYLFRPRGRADEASRWLEDSGRWFAGPDGRPEQAFGVVRQIDDRYQRDQQLRFRGNCDPLTGMMNRGRMAEALGEIMAASRREERSCGFLIATIANLSMVNDAYGFDIADEVIIALGRRLRQVVRAGDAIGRYSGAKFGIILSNCSESELKSAAERFLSIARESVIETERGPVWAMLSIGGLVLPKYAESPNLAMARAEEALAEARRLPSDAFVSYRPSPERTSVRSINAQCAAEIVSGLKEDRFTLAFQPIIDARSDCVVMHEALLRMQTPQGMNIAAVHLVPIAEKLGLIRLIDRRVAMLAVDTLKRVPQAQLTLNVSGITATDPRWFNQIMQMLAEEKEVTSRLTVEITETAALNDLTETARFIAGLRQLGCAVAIDDFGAGYTSFRNLRVLNVDMVKLDGSFCENLSTNRDNQYFVRSLIDLARKFELKTVAEWVQTQEDAKLLKSWGIDYLQGAIYGDAITDPSWPTAVPEPTPRGVDAEPPVAIEARPDSIAQNEPEIQDDPIIAEVPGDALDFSRLRMALRVLDRQFGGNGATMSNAAAL